MSLTFSSVTRFPSGELPVAAYSSRSACPCHPTLPAVVAIAVSLIAAVPQPTIEKGHYTYLLIQREFQLNCFLFRFLRLFRYFESLRFLQLLHFLCTRRLMNLFCRFLMLFLHCFWITRFLYLGRIYCRRLSTLLSRSRPTFLQMTGLTL